MDIPGGILAIGGLGTAAFGLVDSTKAFWGGISCYGFGEIDTALRRFFSSRVNKTDRGNALSYASTRGVLRANWLNGTPLADQKSIAKTLVKLRLDAGNAAHLAKLTGVDADVLTSLAAKYANGGDLTAAEQNVAGRFDLLLTTLLDEAYQRADQKYRNGARALAVLFAVALALAGKWALGDATVGWRLAVIAGLLAAPLAPISKDLASALQSSVKMLQALK